VLPAIALDRARQRGAAGLDGAAVVIIGDTPRDMTCGRALGVRAVGVATGRYSPAELAEAGADVVWPDFRNTAGVTESLFGTSR
jgi:phosphoglycolate phosphatase